MEPTPPAGDRMRAVVSRSYGPPDCVEIEEIARPVPRAQEVLVRNRASVVTAAMVEARRGAAMARLYFGVTRPKWPVLGTNFAGTVEAVGGDVTRFAVGDRVTGVNVVGFAAHAEYVVAPEAGVIIRTPDWLSDIDAVAAFDGSVTALPFLRDRARLAPGQSILINGAAGAVGSAAVQLAKYYGARVTAVCSNANGEAVRALGADVVIDYAAEDFTDARDRYDVIFDAVGKSSFTRSRRALTRDGLFLTTVPSPAILGWMAWTSRFGRRKAAIEFTGLAGQDEMAKNLVFLGALAESGALVPFIGRTDRMEDAALSHQYVESGHKRGSAVITFGHVVRQPAPR